MKQGFRDPPGGRRGHVERLQLLAAALSSAATPETVVGALVEHAVPLVGADDGHGWLVEGGTLVPVASWAPPGPNRGRRRARAHRSGGRAGGILLDVATASIAARALRESTTVLEEVPPSDSPQARSCTLALPIGRNERILGVITLRFGQVPDAEARVVAQTSSSRRERYVPARSGRDQARIGDRSRSGGDHATPAGPGGRRSA